MPRTLARWRRSASSPAPSPIRSSSGVPHECPESRHAADHQEAGRPERGRDVAAEGADQPELHGPGHRARRQPQGLGDLRPGQSERVADVLRLRAQPARDQRAAERHAQEERQDDHG